MIKRNAPGREAEGVECLLPADIDVYATETARIQHLTRFGIPATRAAIIAPHCFGEGRVYA